MKLEYTHPKTKQKMLTRYNVWEHFPENFDDLNFDVNGYNNQTWTIANKDVDLWEHAIAQAKYIRENHDYVRIWYSGGFDSTVVLEAFRRANIKPDEIRILDKDTTNGFFPLYHALEIENNALPYLKSQPFFDDVKTIISPIDEYWINEWYKNNPEFYKDNQHVAVLCWCVIPHMTNWLHSIGEKPKGTVEVIGGQWPNLLVENGNLQCVIVDKQLDQPWHNDIWDFNLSSAKFLQALIQKYVYLHGMPDEGWTKIQQEKNNLFNFTITGAAQMLKTYPITRYKPSDHLANYQVAMWQRITYAYATLANPEWWVIYQKVAQEQKDFFDWNVLGPGIMCKTNVKIKD